MKAKICTLLLLAFSFAGQQAIAQCNPTFTTTPEGNNTYVFQANQVQVAGYTYANSWNVNGANANEFTSLLTYSFSAAGTYQVCHYITIQDANSVTVCSDSSCQSISVAPPCIPVFYSGASAQSGTTCQFTKYACRL